MLIRDESYGHEDPSRALLASEKPLSTRVLGSVVSSRYPLCLGRAISRSKALVPALPSSLTLIRRLLASLCAYVR